MSDTMGMPPPHPLARSGEFIVIDLRHGAMAPLPLTTDSSMLKTASTLNPRRLACR